MKPHVPDVMTFALAFQRRISMSQHSQHSLLNVKALVGASNQEKALVGGFFVIVNSSQTFV